MQSYTSSPLRRLVSIVVASLLVALLALACSSSDDGEQSAAAQAPAAAQVLATDFQVSSPSFSEIRPRVRIPHKNTCYGENVSPPLIWSGAPQGTMSLALIGEDIDDESGSWVHWVLYNIPPGATELVEGIPTSTSVLPDDTKQGLNDYKGIGYRGPCPLQISINYYDEFGGKVKTSKGAHSYVFRLYALNATVDLAPGATMAELLSAMEGHILAQTDTVGKYQVPPTTDRAQEMNRPLHERTPTPTP